MLEFYTETGGTTIVTATQTPEITFQGSLSGTTVAFTGVAGPMGADGVQGLQGERGAKGERGDVGPRGLDYDPTALAELQASIAAVRDGIGASPVFWRDTQTFGVRSQHNAGLTVRNGSTLQLNSPGDAIASSITFDGNNILTSAALAVPSIVVNNGIKAYGDINLGGSVFAMSLATQGGLTVGNGLTAYGAINLGGAVTMQSISTTFGMTAGNGFRAFGNIALDGPVSTFGEVLVGTNIGANKINLRHYAGNASAQDGDLWTTTAGLFGRINGYTQTFAMLDAGNTWTTPQLFRATIISSTDGTVFERVSTDTIATNFTFRKARGIPGTLSPITSGDFVGSFTGQGWDGTAYRRTGIIRFGSTGTFGSNFIPGFIDFRLTNAAGSFVTVATFDNTGGLTLQGKMTSAVVNLPHAGGPASPVNGDVWTTSDGLYVRVNGVTYKASLSTA